MKTAVSPNRMELLKLRQRLALARRGHRLLKEKLEGLVKEFIPLVERYRSEREKIDRAIPGTLGLFTLASATSSRSIVASALSECRGEASVSVGSRSLMGLSSPTFALADFRPEPSYSLVITPPELDSAIDRLRTLLPRILELASLEELLRRLAREIEKTRRRVNALEYVMIPEIVSTRKFIAAKIEENERGSRVRLMKVKEMLEARGV
jgi:V/A-type H+-transporting ATPase subunit D